MTWQVQLQQLDAALAAGKVTPDEYRRQRDELLYQAQSGGNPQPAAQTGPPSDPFPAPFKWSAQQPPVAQPEAAQNQGQTADSTQFIKPVTPPQGEADRTQVVPGGARVEPDRTQVVRPAQQGQWPQQQPQQQQAGQGWPGQPDQGGYPATPWGEGDFGSGAGWNSGGFGVQGPEVFEDVKSGKGKIFAIVGVVVVLAAAAVLYFTVFNKGDDPKPTETTTAAPAPTTTTKKKPDPFGTLIVPEGRTSGPKTYNADQLATAKPLPTPDLVVLKQGGVTEARSVVVVENEITSSLWGFKTADPATLLTAIETDQKRFGFAEDPTAKQGNVSVYKSVQTSSAKTITVFRAHYATANEVIRIEVFAQDEAAAKARFDQVLKEQLEHEAPK
ncbi:SHOCT domain-containing protein [Saccharothrix sp. NPDC042600]|uniref:SHOCT domain-containing protein n=1 Tax=Saccharothrix TaxID=2071 RepID=UPI0033C58247|nr:hypothetical protein GCM10017745_06060 [Saccharothrix mutabilis subsp. capreolus]